jgi:hypothetical protein
MSMAVWVVPPTCLIIALFLTHPVFHERIQTLLRASLLHTCATVPLTLLIEAFMVTVLILRHLSGTSWEAEEVNTVPIVKPAFGCVALLVTDVVEQQLRIAVSCTELILAAVVVIEFARLAEAFRVTRPIPKHVWVTAFGA